MTMRMTGSYHAGHSLSMPLTDSVMSLLQITGMGLPESIGARRERAHTGRRFEKVGIEAFL